MTTLSGKTRLVPILAHPVDHVRAPAIYNPAFQAAGLDWLQVPMGVRPEHLAGTLACLARMGNVQGVNLTLPHKAAGLALCARSGAEARRTGVANTLRLEADGSWSGESFDGVGFVDAARAHGVLDAARPVLIVGTGGAGTAIAFALAEAGVQTLHLLNREPELAVQLAAALRAHHPALHVDTEPRWQDLALAVNATSLGLHAGDPLPFDPARLPAGSAVFDITAARDTELMAAAAAAGHRVVGGKPMIHHQVAAQIAFWRGASHSLASLERAT